MATLHLQLVCLHAHDYPGFESYSGFNVIYMEHENLVDIILTASRCLIICVKFCVHKPDHNQDTTHSVTTSYCRNAL